MAIHFCFTPAITTAVQRIYFASVTFSDERTNEVIIQQELLESLATGESLYWAILVLEFFLSFSKLHRFNEHFKLVIIISEVGQCTFFVQYFRTIYHSFILPVIGSSF